MIDQFYESDRFIIDLSKIHAVGLNPATKRYKAYIAIHFGNDGLITILRTLPEADKFLECYQKYRQVVKAARR